MSQLKRIRREQLIRQAEGYLDLLMCLDDRWALEKQIVESIASRALQALDQLGEKSGRRGHILFLKGQANRICCRYEEAVADFTHALDFESENIHVYLGLAWCYKRLGEIELSIKAMKSALQVQPDNPVLNYNLACYCSVAGNVTQSCDYLLRALEINPELRDLIDREKDFDPVRESPEFQAALALIV